MKLIMENWKKFINERSTTGKRYFTYDPKKYDAYKEAGLITIKTYKTRLPPEDASLPPNGFMAKIFLSFKDDDPETITKFPELLKARILDHGGNMKGMVIGKAYSNSKAEAIKLATEKAKS